MFPKFEDLRRRKKKSGELEISNSVLAELNSYWIFKQSYSGGTWTYKFGEMSLRILCPFLLIHSSFHKHIVRPYHATECTVLRTGRIYNGKQNCVPALMKVIA